MFTILMIDPFVFKSFSKAVQDGYKPITYHNKIHGTDVCQTIYYFLTDCNLKEIGQFDSVDFCSLIIAGAIHDYEHFGFTNDFLINTQHQWALKYNDTSVLENHHVAAAMELTLDKKRNIFENMN